MRQRNTCVMALLMIVVSLFCSSPVLAASRPSAKHSLTSPLTVVKVPPLCQALDTFSNNESRATYPGYEQYMGLIYFESPLKTCSFANHFNNYSIRFKNSAGTYVPPVFDRQTQSIYYYIVDAYKAYTYVLIVPGPPGTQPVTWCTFPLPSCPIWNA